MTELSLKSKAIALAGTWSVPPDLPAKVAVGIALFFAVLALADRGRSLFAFTFHDDEFRIDRRRFLAVASLLAALLSIAYLSIYLRGGPRIVDATTYFLQGRALSHGDLSWEPLDPSASFRGRFLLFTEAHGGSESSLGGIFPPGYPLLLAFGFVLGSPMIIGPLLAAALLVATYHLAHAVAEEAAPELAEAIARAAVFLSLLCAALRYHTADTMSHGAAALGVIVALGCALRARRSEDSAGGYAILSGLAVGYVLATRPISALPIGLVTAWLLGRSRSPRLVLTALAGVLPGLFLLLLSQRGVTGSWLSSTQRMYYAVSDGPRDCFRWGFGKGVGCLFEHGEFVHARLDNGFGVVEATGATLRRLRDHLLDVANLEPLALLVLVPLLRRRALVSIQAATALVGLQILAYAPFYFDGDYPGAGARFFADVLPVEHVLVVVGVVCLVSTKTNTGDAAIGRRARRATLVVLSLSAAGFAVHGSYEHGKLRDRDGGRPMFEPDVLSRVSLKSGLVYVETDHGFALGHDPAARPDRGVVVARRRSDDRDRLLFEHLGRPPSYLYKLETNAEKQTTPSLVPWAPPEHGTSFRFEAEAEWPPLSQEGGLAVPVWASGCSSGNRALALSPTLKEDGARNARATITLPVPTAGRWAVEVHVVHGAYVPFAPAGGEGDAHGNVMIAGKTWSWRPEAACATLTEKEVDLEPPYAVVTIEALGGPIAVDYMSMRKLSAPGAGTAE